MFFNHLEDAMEAVAWIAAGLFAAVAAFTGYGPVPLTVVAALWAASSRIERALRARADIERIES